jgi:hypothetical protein
MRTLIRLALFATGLLAGAALLRKWLEEQPGLEAPAQPAAPSQPAAPAPVTAPLPPDPTVGATRKQLYERARKLDIEGRSKMSKDELADAVRRADAPTG